jgi:hypothetical protein
MCDVMRAEIVDGSSGLFDSLTAVEFSNLLSDTFGLKLPSTLVFDYPSPSSMTAYVHDLLRVHANDNHALVAAGGHDWNINNQADPVLFNPRVDIVAANDDSTHLANLLFANRLPQEYKNCNSVWQGGDSISITPFNRWDVDQAFQASPHMKLSKQIALRAQKLAAEVRHVASLTAFCMICSLACPGCMLAMGASCWGWNSLTPLPLVFLGLKRRSWIHSSVCCWR